MEQLRDVILEMGYRLKTWDTGREINYKPRLGYELKDPSGDILFTGEDFRSSPLWPIDSDATLRGICAFLFLRPGDTDHSYFDSYNEKQLNFAQSSDCELLAFLYSDEGQGEFRDYGQGGG